METITKERINIAPSSNAGHFVEKAKKVVNLDNIQETFFVEGESILTTENHTTLEMKKDCLITCQKVYNPLTKMLEQSKD